ncbi:ABC-type multidrug transport system fused ATPase/permease subunit [Paenibacillus sp. JGP012]|uniref:ABC transporter ATP-binding protein n=1 Tax=Paenibacillus sp. JGP012 TaxID=2735914 RepID=UPI00161309AA|nr:ABC transporter ATP-binding protein [Paenibacillus sp. JGP012]MBB6022753.1 ABC-type multidrug transport system fused ATPase/permease subunit [Paenibacillus sp. JGP012]
MATFKEYGTFLGDYLKPHKKKALSLGGLMLAGTALSLVNPQILKNFIDKAQDGSDINLLLWLGIAFVVIAICGQGLSLLQVYLGQMIGWSTTNDLRKDLLNHSLHLDMSFHTKRTSGEMIERIDGDCRNLFSFFSGVIFQMINSLLLLLGIILVLFFEDWKLGVVLSIFSLCTVLALMRVHGIAVPSAKKALEANTDLMGFLEERFSGLRDITKNGGSSYFLKRFFQFQYALFRASQRAWVISRLSTWSVTIILFAIANVVILSLSVSFYSAGSITIGTIYLVVFYTNMLVEPLQNIANNLQEFQNFNASIQRINELKRTQNAITDMGNQYLTSGPKEVTFNHVSFSYGQGKIVLNDINFKLGKGITLGVLGRTGSGKSTLIRLLSRIYDPSTGTIAVDGVNLRDIPLAHLTEKIGVVTQETYLYQGNIRDNLTFFNSSITDEDIFTAIRSLGIEDWFNRFPKGLDTLIQSGGGGMSSGEAQLIALIRLFLKKPDIIILDEYSSKLDVITESWLQQAVINLMTNRTGIIIAHRLSTVNWVNEIMILENGSIVEHEKREDLESRLDSRYMELLKTGLEVQPN